MRLSDIPSTEWGGLYGSKVEFNGVRGILGEYPLDKKDNHVDAQWVLFMLCDERPRGMGWDTPNCINKYAIPLSATDKDAEDIIIIQTTHANYIPSFDSPEVIEVKPKTQVSISHLLRRETITLNQSL